MELKPGYKQTEIGPIPEDWNVSTIGNEFSVQLGKMLDAERNAGVLKPYLGNRSVRWNKINIDSLDSVPMSQPDLSRFRLRHGDILVCEGGEVGRAAIWTSPLEECYFQKALHRLRPLHAFEGRLMVALLQRWSQIGLLDNYVTQTSIAHLPREKFLQVPIPCPSLPEQQAIAAALSDADALLDGLDRLIAKKRDLKQATMQQLLTGQTRLPGFSSMNPGYKQTEVGVIPEDWDCAPIRDAAMNRDNAIVGGPFGSDLVSADYVIAGVPVIRGQNMSAGLVSSDFVFVSLRKAKSLSANLAYPSDLIFTQRGTLGQVSMVPIGGFECYLVSQSQMKVSLNRTRHDPSFVYQYFVSRAGQKQIIDSAIQTGVPHTNLGILRAYRFPAPPLPEQQAIAAVLSDMDAEIAALEARRDKTRNLKQAMMQELLTGRTRLI